MVHGARTIYPSGQKKGFSPKLQSSEEGWGVQWLKHYEYGNEDEDNSPNNINSVKNYNTVSQKYRQIRNLFYS